MVPLEVLQEARAESFRLAVVLVLVRLQLVRRVDDGVGVFAVQLVQRRDFGFDVIAGGLRRVTVLRLFHFINVRGVAAAVDVVVVLALLYFRYPVQRLTFPQPRFRLPSPASPMFAVAELARVGRRLAAVVLTSRSGLRRRFIVRRRRAGTVSEYKGTSGGAVARACRARILRVARVVVRVASLRELLHDGAVDNLRRSLLLRVVIVGAVRGAARGCPRLVKLRPSMVRRVGLRPENRARSIRVAIVVG